MNYELAKKLKDAGFPLIESTVGYCDNKCHGKDCNEELIRIDGKVYWIPTLSELIEACDGMLAHLGDKSGIGDKRWRAWSFIKDGISLDVQGSTPEEAVANLYLELKK